MELKDQVKKLECHLHCLILSFSKKHNKNNKQTYFKQIKLYTIFFLKSYFKSKNKETKYRSKAKHAPY